MTSDHSAPHRLTVHLEPYVRLNDVQFSDDRDQLTARFGPPLKQSRNAVELTELDYGDRVYRFQDNGRLEEITVRAPVLDLGEVAVPFASLADFVRHQDAGAFERAGFLISPRWGLAFVPHQPDWLTALARHCLPAWHAIHP